MPRRLGQFALCLTLAVAGAASQEPAPTPEADFPARDSHQGVTIAARPVPDTPEAETIFGPKAAPTRAGFLPVELIVRNERKEPIEIVLDRITVTSGPDEFELAAPEAIASWLYPPPEVKEPTVGGPRLPIPWPRGPKAPKDKHRKEREEAEASLRSQQLRAQQVPPGAEARGYLYFDLRGQGIDLTRAAVYIPEVNGAESGEGLLFYEISLKVYAKP